MINQTYIIYGDKIANATVSSSSVFEPSLQNVRDRRLQKIARTEESFITINVVFDEPEYIGGVGILNTNVSDNPLNQWIGYSDASFTDIVVGGTLVQGREPSPAVPPNLYGINAVIATRGQNAACRSMQFIISVDSGGIYIGRLFAGRIFTPENGAKFGSLSVNTVDTSSITRALDGTPYVTERARYRESSMELHALSEHEVYVRDGSDAGFFECLYDIERSVASNAEIIVIPLLLEETIDNVRIMDGQTVYGLAKWGKTEQYERSCGGLLYRKTIEITESV